MSFTADDAFEYQGTEDAIMMTQGAVLKTFRQHGASFEEFIEDTKLAPNEAHYDAGDVLAWLGY